MTKYLLGVAIVASPMLLVGCVAVWGGAYEIESQTADAIVIQYDTNFINDAEIEKLAADHCREYHKTALLQSHNTNIVNISTDTFLCQNPYSNPATAPK